MTDLPEDVLERHIAKLEADLARLRADVARLESELERERKIRLAFGKSSIPALEEFGVTLPDADWLIPHLDGLVSHHPILIIRELAALTLRARAALSGHSETP